MGRSPGRLVVVAGRAFDPPIPGAASALDHHLAASAIEGLDPLAEPRVRTVDHEGDQPVARRLPLDLSGSADDAIRRLVFHFNEAGNDSHWPRWSGRVTSRYELGPTEAQRVVDTLRAEPAARGIDGHAPHLHARSMRAPLSLVASLVLALAAACPTPPDPAADAGPDPDAGPAWPPDAELSAFTPCAEPNASFECATLTIAIDDGDAAAGLMSLPVMRAPALDAAQRRGVLLFHPGGPGPSPLSALPTFVNNLDASVPEVRAIFDVAALAQPGTPGSDPLLDCGGPEGIWALTHLANVPRDEEGRALLESDIQALVDACSQGSGEAQLAAASAESTARTMDALRALFGVERLSFFGASYGTLVGAAYASLFPERVDRMVLDSSVQIDRTAFALTRASIEGIDDGLNQFFRWCASTTRCRFFQPGGPDAVASAYDALLARYDATPVELPQGAGQLTGKVIAGLLFSALPSANWQAVGASLAGFAADDLGLGFGSLPPPPPDVSPDAYFAILGVDYADAMGFDAYFDALAPVAAAHPRVTQGAVAWPLAWPVASPLTLSAPTAPAILVIGGAHDPATPLSGTEPMRAAIGNGSYGLLYEGDGHAQTLHQCPLHAAAAYLVDGTAPPASCPAESYVVDTTAAGTIALPFAVDDLTRTTETILGNFVVDAMRARTGTTIALTNAGALRRGTALPSGVVLDGVADRAAQAPVQLVVGDWYEVLPFEDAVVTRPITGALLHAVIEHGLEALPAAASAFILPSGLRYSFDVTRPAGERLTSVTLDDGTPVLADDTSYDLTTDSFMTAGKGDFTMLAGVPVTFVETMARVVAARAAEVGALPTAIDGRITAE